MIILASKSPRRKELLKKITNDFIIIPSDVDESILHTKSDDLAIELSKLKAYSIFNKYPNDTILSCDTIVVFKNEIMGKPKTKEEAKTMLKKLSGNKHTVISGYTFINKNKEINRSVRTDVYFNILSDELIDSYVSTGSPMDKAGAYGIQDKDFNLVHHIDGDYENVMGLPINDIKKHCF